MKDVVLFTWGQLLFKQKDHFTRVKKEGTFPFPFSGNGGKDYPSDRKTSGFALIRTTKPMLSKSIEKY